ncbi:hypothetical protein [Fluviicola taffensis]|uniref:hypothetical protein n=1 Tax=Fluviicola taffensis TaxID=191579 RepID=UPI00313846B8
MEQCPICYHELEVRDCAPCDDCGWDAKEINHLNQGIHTYTTYEVYNGLQLTLCNFCDVDFGSYRPEFFGFSNGKRIGFQNFAFVKELVDPQVTKDKFCPKCSMRLKFLTFLSAVRAMNEK